MANPISGTSAQIFSNPTNQVDDARQKSTQRAAAKSSKDQTSASDSAASASKNSNAARNTATQASSSNQAQASAEQSARQQKPSGSSSIDIKA
jgi:hypothetical protein